MHHLILQTSFGRILRCPQILTHWDTSLYNTFSYIWQVPDAMSDGIPMTELKYFAKEMVLFRLNSNSFLVDFSYSKGHYPGRANLNRYALSKYLGSS